MAADAIPGYTGHILRTIDDYQPLLQADTFDDLTKCLANPGMGYADALGNNEIKDTRDLERALKKALIEEFHTMRGQSSEPLSKFLDYITIPFQISNLCLLIKGAIKGEDVEKLIMSCHNVGTFPNMEGVCAQTTTQGIYDAILVDTALAPYFAAAECLSIEDLSQADIESMRDKLHKEYLTDFYRFCTEEVGGTTGEIMAGLLEFEADYRAIIIAINSLLHTDMTKQDKLDLNPKFGSLYPAGFAAIAACMAEEQVYAELSMNYAATYGVLVDEMMKSQGTDDEKYMEEVLMEEEVRRNALAFDKESHFGIVYAYVKLKEQEIRNITWIAECLKQQRKNRMLQNVICPFQAP